MDSRIEPPYVLDERTMLVSWLEYHRGTLAVKCDGVSDDQLRIRSVEPSTMSLLGLVRHMADVERHWFRQVLQGEDAAPIFFSDTDPDGDFDNVDTASVDEAFRTWREQCETARDAVDAAESVDDLSVGLKHEQHVSLRWILVHMIEEYARHNGHADLLRERIDGAVGE
jgi:uncharacterized damage-inducible protein DinB